MIFPKHGEAEWIMIVGRTEIHTRRGEMNIREGETKRQFAVFILLTEERWCCFEDQIFKRNFFLNRLLFSPQP